MKYDLVSDLHIEFDKFDINWIARRNHNSEILVIAGDTSNYPSSTVNEIYRASEAYKHVIFVDGNHEHYNNRDTNQTVRDTEKYFEQEFENISNITYLSINNPIKIIEYTAFVGCNSWYDFKFIPDNNTVQQCIAQYLADSNDSKYCNFKIVPEMMAINHANAMANSVEELQHKDYDNVTKIVTVTHTSPASEGVTWKMHDGYWNLFNGAYGNSCMSWVWEADKKNKIVHSVYGHVHNQHDVIINNGIRIIANPRGYVGHEPSASHWKIRQFDTSDERGVIISAFGDIKND